MIKTIIDKFDHVYGVDNLPPVNLASGDWTPYLQSYEPQSFNYKDTDECSQLGGFISPLEIYFNWLKATNQIPPSFLAFLLSNGYWNGTSFAFSERYIAILDGTSINGNVMHSGYEAVTNVGIIPRSMLMWSLTEAAQYPTQALMDTSYYDPSAITPNMTALGQQFLSYIQSFNWGWLWNGNGSCPLATLAQGLKTSPCALAVPVDSSVWNQVQVPYTQAAGTATDHCICHYKSDTSPFPTYFTDQYVPFLKQFQADYFIPVVIMFTVQLKPESTAVVSPPPPVYQLPSWITWFARLFK
jgi:hypothetical protein